MKISFLGTAGARVDSRRDNTSVLIETNGQLILVDCSGNPVGKILRLGYEMAHLDAVLLTHLHIDHCYGLPALLFHMFLEGRSESLILAAPEEEFDVLEKQLEAYQVYPSVRSYSILPIRVKDIPDTLVFDSQETTVTAVPMEHSRAARAYRILEKSSGRSVVITGDTSPCSGLTRFAEQTDLLIHESTFLEDHRELAHEYGHSTARDAGQAARNASARSLALVHFDLNNERVTDDFRAEASQVFDGHIYTPDDLDVIEI